MIAAARQRFLADYLRIRRAEGRGSDDPSYYLTLPHEPIRQKTFQYFERHILPPMEREKSAPLNVLDLGAGTGWLSYRLAKRGHRPLAVDILGDRRDGLGAARHYDRNLERSFTRVEADFDHLPLPRERFDVILYNASLHYSADYTATLVEAKRCLAPRGRIVVLDSPVYRSALHGELMRRERHAQFLKQYGTESDHAGSIEYLDLGTIGGLAREVGIRWRIHKPWYGFAWHSRPWKARWKGTRPPSRFWILEGTPVIQ